MTRPALPAFAAAVLAFAGSAALAAPPPTPASGSRGVQVLDPSATEAPATPPPPQAAPSPPLPPPAPPPQPKPAAAVCDHAFAGADLAYADTDGFDRSLAQKLTAGTADRGVVIDTPPFPPDTALPRLVGWLSTIQASGGEVTRHDIVCSRGFSLGRLLHMLFARPEKPDLYAPARTYNAALWIEPASGRVRQVQLVRRPPS